MKTSAAGAIGCLVLSAGVLAGAPREAAAQVRGRAVGGAQVSTGVAAPVASAPRMNEAVGAKVRETTLPVVMLDGDDWSCSEPGAPCFRYEVTETTITTIRFDGRAMVPSSSPPFHLFAYAALADSRPCENELTRYIDSTTPSWWDDVEPGWTIAAAHSAAPKFFSSVGQSGQRYYVYWCRESPRAPLGQSWVALFQPAER